MLSGRYAEQLKVYKPLLSNVLCASSIIGSRCLGDFCPPGKNVHRGKICRAATGGNVGRRQPLLGGGGRFLGDVQLVPKRADANAEELGGLRAVPA